MYVGGASRRKSQVPVGKKGLGFGVSAVGKRPGPTCDGIHVLSFEGMYVI